MTDSTSVARLYWNQRASRFASRGDGLAAVASYGMPAYYNLSTDLVQWLSLRPWLRDVNGMNVLDVGCGIGRWSRRLAKRGARVIGVDPSTSMIAEARRRSLEEAAAERCSFVAADITELRMRSRFDRIFAVTVLQHLVNPGELERALENLEALLAPDGRIVLLEVAPETADERCDGTRFASRTFAAYCDRFRSAGLRLEDVRGVDPSLLKIKLLPHYKSLPRPMAHAAMMTATALATPFDLVLGRALRHRSWHKVMVLAHDG